MVKNKVALAYIQPGSVKDSFMSSVIRTMLYEIQRTGQAFNVLSSKVYSGNLATSRNDLITKLLKEDAEWFWLVDTDMGFPVDTLQQLLYFADRKRPVMGALCFSLERTRFDESNFSEEFKIKPVISMWHEDMLYDLEEYPKNSLFKVGMTSVACILIHRSVFEKLKNNWFTLLINQGNLLGEDISFFYRLKDYKIPVYLNSAVKTSHDKGGIFLTEELYLK